MASDKAIHPFNIDFLGDTVKAKAKGEGKEAVGDDTAADNAWHAASFDICSLHSSFLVMRRHHVIVS